MKTIEKNTIFTNVALTQDKDVWWEGMTKTPPEGLISWKNQPWDQSSKELSSHPNARLTVEAKQCPIVSQEIDNPQGVPISALIFGGRRASLEPLVYEALSWDHGVFLGAALTSEMTAAAKGVIGQVRHDPFAMLPFCGYNMADYFTHWFEMGSRADRDKLPKIYHVNWFKKDATGKFLWPGYGDNARVLKWIFERVSGSVDAQSSPLGLVPKEKDFDVTGLTVAKEDLQSLFAVDVDMWEQEALKLKEYFLQFGSRLPNKILLEISQLQQRLSHYHATSHSKS